MYGLLPKDRTAEYSADRAVTRIKTAGTSDYFWTCRCGNQLEEAVEWCRKWELEFDAVNENLPEIIERYGSDGRKIYADVYIDDKSCFPWEVKKDEKVGL